MMSLEVFLMPCRLDSKSKYKNLIHSSFETSFLGTGRKATGDFAGWEFTRSSIN